MAWTKRQLVEKAFEEIGLAAYVFDLSPGQIQSATEKMDMMMALWNKKGIRIGYSFTSTPDPDDETEVQDEAAEAIYTNLAKRLAPSIGKTISPETAATAKSSYKELLSLAGIPPEKKSDRMFRGSGDKPWRKGYNYNNSELLPTPDESIDAGPDSEIDLD